MLKRIKFIHNIGCFKICDSANIQFEKITLIFGRNTYGKSTLSDLLSSIESGDCSRIKTRKTIPTDNRPQKAELAFQADGKNNETSISLHNNSWQSSLPEGLSLHIFDDGFYHNNLFSGRLFTRATKEKFSSFILGTQGVTKAKDIAEKNKRKDEATRERNRLQKAAFNDIENINDFLKFTPKESIGELEEKIDSLRQNYSDLDKQIKNADRILSRENLTNLAWETGFSKSLESLNKTLQTSLKNYHEEARLKLTKHIQINFINAQNAERWIQQGLNDNNGKNCQFCGQVLSEEALRLLEIYRESFDTSYQRHDDQIKQELRENSSLLIKDQINPLKISIESNKSKLFAYPELVENAEYLSIKENIDRLSHELDNIFDVWKQYHPKFQEELDAIIKQKQLSPHKAVEEIHPSQLIESSQKIDSFALQYNEYVHQTNKIFAEFKQSVRDDLITKRLTEIKHADKEAARKKRRLELANQCDDYIRLDSTIKLLSNDINRLQQELRNEQSAYIQEFFDRINKYFNIFGSQNFKLEKGEDNTGHTPIYYLKVKFYGIDVSEKDLDQIFSESDRRALALSIFWSRLTGLTQGQRRNAIIVLDDPMTSFDNHRMTAVHQEIIKISEISRQVIVLSHFEYGISCFLKTYKDERKMKLLSIVKKSDTSILKPSDIETFIKNEHEKAREKIFKFISGGTNDHSANELRVFFENEVGYRFAKQIALHNINERKFSDRIDRLNKVGAISFETAQEAHNWRETLNPLHHTWTDNDIEDRRSTAERLMNFIYHKLLPL